MTDPEFCRRGNQLLVTESADPDWSRVTEQRLRAIWRENVTGLSDEFLFVMCKTTVCQLNYRFPTEFIYDRTPGNTLDSRNRHFGAFHAGFSASDLASELRRDRITFAGAIIAMEFTRKGTQPSDQ